MFSGQLPELNLLEAEAGRDFFRGTPPSEYDTTDNMRFVGFSARPAAGSLSEANSDVAFQGKRVYQGTFPGFRIIDINNPSKPKEIINYTDCRHPSGQGDVIIYGDILTRSWDSSSSAGMPAGGWPCGDSRVQAGQEGLHVFDVSDPENPDVDAFIDLPCGSHTATGVPDPANDRLIVYSTPSSGACNGIDVIEIPVGDPSAASYHHFEAAASGIACHDTGVILGDVLKAACAGGQGFAVWSMAAADGGTLIDPALLYTRNMKVSDGININTGHSAAFSNDGDTLIFGHEPNGGTSARCQKTGTVLNNATYPVQTDDMKSFFFFDVATGTLQGKWTLPRDQSAFENCTLHNYNVVPSQEPRHPRARQLSVGHRRGRLLRREQPQGDRLRRSEAAEPERVHGRRRLVVALLQRADLPVRHHPRPAVVGDPGRRAGRHHAPGPPEPADPGVHDLRLDDRRGGREPGPPLI